MARLWYYITRLDLYSFPLLLCTSTVSQGLILKVFFNLSPKPFTAAVGEALTTPPVCRSACLPAFIMTVMQTVTLLLFQRQLTFYNQTLGWHLRI